MEQNKELLSKIQYGEDVFLSHNSEITNPQFCKIGNHVAIDFGFYCTAQLEVGDHCHISAHVGVIGSKISSFKMGHFCFCSLGSRIICASDEFFGAGLINPTIPKQYHDNLINEPVVFENFSGVAAGCIVLPGVTLGEGSVVGAGSLVTKDTEPWTIYIGTPAKPYKKRIKENMIKYAKEMGYDFYTSV